MVRFIQNNFIGMPNMFMTRNNCCHHHNNNMLHSTFGYGFKQPMMFGGCVHNHHSCNGGGGGSDDGIGKAMLWGAGLGGAAALLIAFNKPIGKFLGMCGKGIGQGATWLWNKALKPAGQAIGKAASWTWNKILKPVGKGIGNFFKSIWNGIKGIFKKKPKNVDEVKPKEAEVKKPEVTNSADKTAAAE